MIRRYPLPSREETVHLRDAVKKWNPDIWHDWSVALDDLENVYTPLETMSEQEARDKLLLIHTKVLVHLVHEGLAEDNVDALQKTKCVETLLFIEKGRKVANMRHQYLLPPEK